MKRSVTAVLTALVLLLLIPACTASPGTDALTEGTLTGVPGTPDGGSDAPAATDAANTTEATTAEPTTLPPDPVQEALEDGRVDYVRIRTEVRERLGSFLWREMKRHPVILPVIMEVEV